ncbi:MAG: peptide chain release factor N(5)-glutamine methyltransferase [Candidatus Cloacimonetes bacterium]|nr:peptide chain release factor N(5)-glutamine methyltransferase [Candidatus Cloacimonadota bacterium]
MKSIIELLYLLRNELASSGIQSSNVEAELILSHFLNMKRFELYLSPRLEVTSEQEKMVYDVLEKRCTHYPLQYLLGSVEFYDTVIEVNPSVLIPRPETELLVEKVLSDNSHSELKVLDIGTGSGAIAIALKKKRPLWQLTATDISESALVTARHNAELNKCGIEFLLSDIWENIDAKFDVIISNPPYITESDYAALSPELHYEPKQALTSAEDGLYFYRIILADCQNYLPSDGRLYLETGSEQARAVKDMASQIRPANIAIFPDLNNFDRIIRITF